MLITQIHVYYVVIIENKRVAMIYHNPHYYIKCKHTSLSKSFNPNSK